MSGIRRHGRGAGTGHPPLNGHGRRAIVPLGHTPAPPRVERENPPTREPDVVERLLRKTIG